MATEYEELIERLKIVSDDIVPESVSRWYQVDPISTPINNAIATLRTLISDNTSLTTRIEVLKSQLVALGNALPAAVDAGRIEERAKIVQDIRERNGERPADPNIGNSQVPPLEDPIYDMVAQEVWDTIDSMARYIEANDKEGS